MAPSDKSPVRPMKPMPHYPLPPPDQVKLRQELAGLRQVLGKLHLADRTALDEALALATGEAAKPTPDKGHVAEACRRIIAAAQVAQGYREHAPDILPRIVAISSWLGQSGPALLKAAGIIG